MDELWPVMLRMRTDVMFGVGLLIAAVVTFHVLLRKREVASAVGWIGLAWFAPITGAVAYFMFGVNRVQRRARRLRGQDSRRSGRGTWPNPDADDHLDPLARGIARVTGRPMLTTEPVQVFNNGDEAYPPMLAAIAAARSSVGMSSYIFEDDTWGGKFIAALAEAHERGVAVCVLVDGIGGGWVRSRAYHALRGRSSTCGRTRRSW
jgi:cardiolipin synthase